MSFIPSNKNIPGLEILQVDNYLTYPFVPRLGADVIFLVMYIPAVPLTSQNQAYVEKQKTTFLSGDRPPDFPKGRSESNFVGVGTVNDIVGVTGRRAMGLQEA